MAIPSYFGILKTPARSNAYNCHEKASQDSKVTGFKILQHHPLSIKNKSFIPSNCGEPFIPSPKLRLCGNDGKAACSWSEAACCKLQLRMHYSCLPTGSLKVIQVDIWYALFMHPGPEPPHRARRHLKRWYLHFQQLQRDFLHECPKKNSCTKTQALASSPPQTKSGCFGWNPYSLSFFSKFGQ